MNKNDKKTNKPNNPNRNIIKREILANKFKQMNQMNQMNKNSNNSPRSILGNKSSPMSPMNSNNSNRVSNFLSQRQQTSSLNNKSKVSDSEDINSEEQNEDYNESQSTSNQSQSNLAGQILNKFKGNSSFGKAGLAGKAKATVLMTKILFIVIIIVIIILLVLVIFSFILSVASRFSQLFSFGEWFGSDTVEIDGARGSAERKFNEKLEKYVLEYENCGGGLNERLLLSTIFYTGSEEKVYDEESSSTFESENPETEDAQYEDSTKKLKSLVKNMVEESGGSCRIDTDKYDDYLRETYIPKYMDSLIANSETRDSDIERIINDIHDQAVAYEFWADIKENDECITTGTACSYNIDGKAVSDIKVELINCNATNKSNSEVLMTLDFEDYIKGVVYAETGGYPIEAQKAQAIAARSFALTRQGAMCPGSSSCFVGYNAETNVIRMRACENDQVFCDWRTGCSRSGSGNVAVYTQGTPGWKSGMSGEELTAFESAMDEVSGKVLVDANGDIVYTNYTQSKGQNQWKTTANAGGDYYAALLSYYGTDKEVVSNCTTSTTQVDLGMAGSTHLPIEDYVEITLKHGQRKKNGELHQGIDYAAPEGTPIYAIADGVVTQAEDSTDSYGKWVKIEHDIDGDNVTDYTSIYAHMSERLANEGDEINGGQLIGKVGATGNTTGNHLHFEIHDKDGNSIDPDTILGSIESGTSELADTNASTSSTGATRAAEDIYYNQHDYEQAYCGSQERTYSCNSHSEKATISTSGCGVTSLAITAATLNNDPNITPNAVASWVCDEHPEYREGGTLYTFFSDTTMQNKFKVSITSIWTKASNNKPSADSFMESILTNLQDGKMIIASLQDSRLDYHKIAQHGGTDPGNNVWGTAGGHYVVLSSINEEGKIKVLDPASNERTGYFTQDEIKNSYAGKVNSGMWAVASNNASNGDACVSNYSQSGEYSTWKQGSYVSGASTPWENVTLGSSGKTIRQIGCTSTSVAIQMARSGTQINVNPFNPGVFVETLSANGGYSGGAITWTGWQSIAPNWKYDGKHYFTPTRVASEMQKLISEGKYLVSCVRFCKHWVAIDRVEGNTIYMFDPSSNETILTDKYDISGVTQTAVFHKTD